MFRYKITFAYVVLVVLLLSPFVTTIYAQNPFPYEDFFVQSIRLNSDGTKLLVTGDANAPCYEPNLDFHKSYVLDVQTLMILTTLVGHSTCASYGVWSHDSTMIVTNSGTEMYVWNALTGEQISSLPPLANIGGQLSWRADDSLIGFMQYYGLTFMDPYIGIESFGPNYLGIGGIFHYPTEYISAEWHPTDNNLTALFDTSGNLVFASADNQVLRVHPLSDTLFAGLQFNRDGHYILAVDSGVTMDSPRDPSESNPIDLIVIQTDNPSLMTRIPTGFTFIGDLGWSLDGKLVYATSSPLSEIRIWNAQTGALVKAIQDESWRITTAAIGGNDLDGYEVLYSGQKLNGGTPGIERVAFTLGDPTPMLNPTLAPPTPNTICPPTGTAQSP